MTSVLHNGLCIFSSTIWLLWVDKCLSEVINSINTMWNKNFVFEKCFCWCHVCWIKREVTLFVPHLFLRTTKFKKKCLKTSRQCSIENVEFPWFNIINCKVWRFKGEKKTEQKCWLPQFELMSTFPFANISPTSKQVGGWIFPWYIVLSSFSIPE